MKIDVLVIKVHENTSVTDPALARYLQEMPSCMFVGAAGYFEFLQHIVMEHAACSVQYASCSQLTLAFA